MRRLTEEDVGSLNRLLSEPIEYVDDPIFRKRRVEELLFGNGAASEPGKRAKEPGKRAKEPGKRAKGPARRAGGDTPEGPNEFPPPMSVRLTAEQELTAFRKFNYARYRMYRIIEEHHNKRMLLKAARELLLWNVTSLAARSDIVQANVPLVLAMAKRTRLSSVDFSDLISEGNMALLRSADKFDCSRGFKFSTYACRAIIKSFSRVAMRTSRYRGRFPVEFDPAFEKSDYIERKRENIEEDCVDELRGILRRNVAELSGIEQAVLDARFALDQAPDDPIAAPRTLKQVGKMMGVTKERVRQIQNRALRKLRAVLEKEALVA